MDGRLRLVAERHPSMRRLGKETGCLTSARRRPRGDKERNMRLSGGFLVVARRVVPMISTPLLAIVLWGPMARADQARAWGSNSFGQLGAGNVVGGVSAPLAVKNLTNGLLIVGGGGNHSLGIMDGSAWGWGWNADGQVGDGTSSNRNAPVPISGLASGVSSVAAGYQHSLAVKDGAVWAWGYNGSGQLGDGTYDNHNAPVPVSAMSSGVTAVAGGGQYSLALQDGGVWAWGSNTDGQLGDGTRTMRPTPALIGGLATGVTAIASGGNHSLVVKGGAVWAWGNNDYGQLGDGTSTTRLLPVQLSALSSGVAAVSAGNTHSLAIREGNVWAWGSNSLGQLGDGTKTARRTPVQIDPVHLNNIISVAAGQRSSFAVSADGHLWVWGDNSYGLLGLGDSAERLTPTELLPPSGYAFSSVDTDAYSYHVVATLALVPEPSGLSLTALVAGFALLRRHKRRSADLAST